MGPIVMDNQWLAIQLLDGQPLVIQGSGPRTLTFRTPNSDLFTLLASSHQDLRFDVLIYTIWTRNESHEHLKFTIEIDCHDRSDIVHPHLP